MKDLATQAVDGHPGDALIVLGPGAADAYRTDNLAVFSVDDGRAEDKDHFAVAQGAQGCGEAARPLESLEHLVCAAPKGGCGHRLPVGDIWAEPPCAVHPGALFGMAPRIDHGDADEEIHRLSLRDRGVDESPGRCVIQAQPRNDRTPYPSAALSLQCGGIVWRIQSSEVTEAPHAESRQGAQHTRPAPWARALLKSPVVARDVLLSASRSCRRSIRGPHMGRGGRLDLRPTGPKKGGRAGGTFAVRVAGRSQADVDGALGSVYLTRGRAVDTLEHTVCHIQSPRFPWRI